MGRPRLLNGSRAEFRALDSEVLAMEVDGFAGPQVADDLQRLVGAGPAGLLVDAVAGESLWPRTKSDPKVESSVGDDIEDSGVFCEPHRIVERQRGDAGGDPHRLGAGGHRGGGDHG